MINRLYLLLLLALPGIGATTAPAQPEHSGTIAVVHGPGSVVVIDDRSYSVPPAIPIEHADGRTGSPSDLFVGRQILFDFLVDDKGYRHLTRVLIPSGGSEVGSAPGGSQAPGGL